MVIDKEFGLDMDANPLDANGFKSVSRAVIEHIRSVIGDSGETVKSVCKKAGISRAAYYKTLLPDSTSALHKTVLQVGVSKKEPVRIVCFGSSVTRLAIALGVKMKIVVTTKNGDAGVVTYTVLSAAEEVKNG